jgi:signal transduction histidine kinase
MSVDISKLNTALVIICGIILFVLTLLVFFVILLRKRHNYFLKERELLEARFEQVLLQSQLEIQEQSFTQISTEIHDNIGQMLSLVRLNLNTPDFTTDQQKLQFTDNILGKAIGDLRSLSHNLHTDHILKTGFCNAVQYLLKSLEQTALFHTDFQVEDDLMDLSDEKTLILFRIVQEAVNNIVKHAEATTIAISVQLMHGEDRQIRIVDNGKGMRSGGESQGLGIRNMQQRARMIGAKLEFAKCPEGGTAVIIAI